MKVCIWKKLSNVEIFINGDYPSIPKKSDGLRKGGRETERIFFVQTEKLVNVPSPPL